MDPEQCWTDLLNALRDGDVGAAEDAASDLALWTSRGGFMPQGLIQALERS